MDATFANPPSTPHFTRHLYLPRLLTDLYPLCWVLPRSVVQLLKNHKYHTCDPNFWLGMCTDAHFFLDLECMQQPLMALVQSFRLKGVLSHLCVSGSWRKLHFMSWMDPFICTSIICFSLSSCLTERSLLRLWWTCWSCGSCSGLMLAQWPSF